MDCGGRSSTGGRLSSSSHRLPKSCESKEGNIFAKEMMARE